MRSITLLPNRSYLDVSITISIPENLSDITLGQYQRFLKVEGDEEFHNHKMVEIFCGVALKDVNRMKYQDVQHIVSKLEHAFAAQPGLTMRWNYNNVEYGFIPNLEDITLGEYTDIDTLLEDWQNMHRVMAILYRPVNHSFKAYYTIEEYETSTKYAEVMKNLPLDIALGGLGFIYRLGMELCKDTLLSLAAKVKEMTLPDSQPKPGSLNDGDGITSSTHLQTAMRAGLMQLLALIYTTPSISLNTGPRRPS